jgi:hypothetical protein
MIQSALVFLVPEAAELADPDGLRPGMNGPRGRPQRAARILCGAAQLLNSRARLRGGPPA